MNRALRAAVERSLLVPAGAAIALAFAVNDVAMALFFALIAQEVLATPRPRVEAQLKRGRA